MALFPTDAKNGQLLEADNGVYYVYSQEKNVWQSNNVIPKWSDQVFIRGVENQTQQNVNDANKAVNNKVGSIAAGTSQLVEVAFDVKTRGVWKHQSGAVAPGDPPVGLQCFLIEPEGGGKTQQYGEAAVLVIHAIGGGEMDRIAIGATEIGDLITIQNQNDLQGGSYIVTGIEEFNSDNPDELTDAYARYTVTVNEKATIGGFSADEMVTIRIFPRATEGASAEDFDDRYLNLVGGTANKMKGNLYLGGWAIKGVGNPDLSSDAANKGYVDEKIAAIPEPEVSGGGFTEEYNGNRYYKAGTDTTALSEGEVMFLSGNATTEVFAGVTHVGLPEAGIDWTKFTRMGTIEVRNGSTVCGHLQVVSAKNNPGRNWLVKVKMLDIETNTLSPESGHPCYFWGMFTD